MRRVTGDLSTCFGSKKGPVMDLKEVVSLVSTTTRHQLLHVQTISQVQ
jgi:hypothetical protein